MSSGRPGRRVTNREVKAQERRQQILTVAKRLFAEEGYHATSMRMLNKELGTAEALTYHYFPGGKLEILQTVLREGRAQLIAEMQTLTQQLRDDLSLREALQLAARIGIAIFSGDKELLQIVMRERNWLRGEEWMAALNVSNPVPTGLLDSFARRMARGEIRQMDLPFAFMQFFSGIIMYVLMGEDAESAAYERYLARLVDFTVQLWSP